MGKKYIKPMEILVKVQVGFLAYEKILSPSKQFKC